MCLSVTCFILSDNVIFDSSFFIFLTTFSFLAPILSKGLSQDQFLILHNPVKGCSKSSITALSTIQIGNITIEKGAQLGDFYLAGEIQKSVSEVDWADIQAELKDTLKQLAEAVATMSRSLPEMQAAEAIDDLSKLITEVTKPTPNRKWYSISVDGLVKAAENVEKVGEPVIRLSQKVLFLLGVGIRSL
jgi:hypothetical protein